MKYFLFFLIGLPLTGLSQIEKGSFFIQGNVNYGYYVSKRTESVTPDTAYFYKLKSINFESEFSYSFSDIFFISAKLGFVPGKADFDPYSGQTFKYNSSIPYGLSLSYFIPLIEKIIFTTKFKVSNQFLSNYVQNGGPYYGSNYLRTDSKGYLLNLNLQTGILLFFHPKWAFTYQMSFLNYNFEKDRQTVSLDGIDQYSTDFKIHDLSFGFQDLGVTGGIIYKIGDFEK